MSAVLVRRFPISREVQRTLESMRVAGDWYFIVEAIKHGDVFYSAKELNRHRRHSKSVIAQTISGHDISRLLAETCLVQKGIFTTYALTPEFVTKWEEYLEELWRSFSSHAQGAELQDLYPLDEMRALLLGAPQSRALSHAA